MRRNKQLRGTPCIALKAILASKRFNRGGPLASVPAEHQHLEG